MFATQRLAASATGVCWAGAWQMTSIDRDSFPHGTRPARRASTGTRSARDSPGTTGIDRDSFRTGLGSRRRAFRTTGVRTRPASRAPRTTGYRTRPASRAPRTTSVRTRPARVRHGRHGSPVFPRIDTHEGRSVRDSPCPAWASWIAGFPALRYP